MSTYSSTALITIFVFGILFSLLYSSSFLANQKAESFYQVLASKKADIEVYRLRSPQIICFDLDREILKQIDNDMAQEQKDGRGDTLSRAIKDADKDALSDQQLEKQMTFPNEYFRQMGNHYTGEGLRLQYQSKAFIPLIREYEGRFNHTIIHKSIRDVSDDVNQYHCNFSYNGNYYGISIKFYSLASLNEYSGFLPITITSQELQENKGNHMPQNNNSANDGIVYRMFNNTVVWVNKSNSWLTLEISPVNSSESQTKDVCCSDLEPIAVRLAPYAAWDVYLGPNLGRIDTTFHYQIKEYPWIEGNILLKNYPLCMDFDTAKSLYSQTKFPFKTPSYLPQGYEYKCMQAEASNVQIFYANRTFSYREMGQGIGSGEIILRMSDDSRYFGLNDEEASLNDTARAMQDYQSILQGNPSLDPQLIDINGKLAWGNEASPTGAIGNIRFQDGSETTTRSDIASRLRFYENGVLIHLEGFVPLDELAKVARSLNYH